MVDPILITLGFAAAGAFIRLVWGIWRAFETSNDIALTPRRMVFEFGMGFTFGIVGGMMLSGFNIMNIGINLGALLSGLLGPNIVEVITKKLGYSKKMDVIVSDQQLDFVDLDMDQMRAMQYVKSHGRINNSIYQKLNGTDRDQAKYELSSLVGKRRLKRVGKGKKICYIAL